MAIYTNRSKKRDKDEKKTQLVNKFLDKYLYTSENGFTNVVRNETKSKQVKGIDIEFDYDGRHYVCDEKASTDEKYIKNYLSTFCLELSMINQIGELSTGWFINDELVNDSYLMVWVDGARNPDLKTVDDITKVEVALVRKSKLKNYFEDRDWSTEALKIKAENIRNKTNQDENMGGYYKYGLKFSFSEYLPEQPINVLLKREIYRELSDFNKIIDIK